MTEEELHGCLAGEYSLGFLCSHDHRFHIQAGDAQTKDKFPFYCTIKSTIALAVGDARKQKFSTCHGLRDVNHKWDRFPHLLQINLKVLGNYFWRFKIN